MEVEFSYLTKQFGVNEEPVKVKYLDLAKGFDTEATLNAIREQLKVCQFTLGPEVAEVESKFAALCGTNYAVGLNSGTDALFLSLKALGIGPGDEVITAPNSFIATAGAIVAVGATPVFVDVNDEYNINPDLIEEAITSRTKAIMPVHLTGNPANMPRILEIAKRYNLHIIEDAAQAIGASIDGKSVGSFGITGCFSMHPLKNLNVWGDGGVVVTNSKEMFETIGMLRNHGLKDRDEVEFFGYNSRLDTIQAIVALNLMKDLDKITNTRIRNARIYDQGLSDLGEFIRIPPRKSNVKSVFHIYVVQAQDRDRLLEYLSRNGIEAKVHYPIPIHRQKAWQRLGHEPGNFPVCEAQARSIITLPVHQHLTDQQLTYVIDTIHSFYKS